ncbi:MAG: hypothetical protein EBV06_15290 [Planctomycetia bacterium]|nr:hypothetical protein [Planctomycetia bacterium]
MVPVMSQRAVTMYEPVLSCSPTSNAPAVAVVPSPSTIAPPQAAPPSGTERRDPNSALPAPPPGGTEKSELAPDTAQPRYGPPVPMNPSASRSISKPAPSLRFDRTASVDGSSVLGRMTDEGRVPLSQSRVLFVNADDKNEQYQATTDGDGVFRTRLASGGWLVYTFDAKGKPVFSRRIEVTKDKGVNFTLVNR